MTKLKFQSYYLQQNNVDQLSFFVKHFDIFHNWVVNKKSIQKTKLQSFMVDIVGEIMYVNIDQ